jgi:hypothetical protein
MKKFFFGIMVIFASFAISCGGGGGKKEIKASQQQKDSAKNCVTNVASLQSLKTNPDANTAFESLGKIQGDAMVLYAAAISEKTSGLTLGKIEGPAVECATESGGKITYNNCTYGSSGSSVTVNGTVKVEGDKYTMDLTIKASYSGMTYDMKYDGTITATASTVNGSLDFEYTTQGSTYTISIDFNNIGLTNNCPTSGSMSMDVDVTVQGYSGSPGAVTIDFGPNCGDVIISA